MWVRGLKLLRCVEDITTAMSHPMWVRGLKQDIKAVRNLDYNVAPHVGAWIETLPHSVRIDHILVAPHVGAWIETFVNV